MGSNGAGALRLKQTKSIPGDGNPCWEWDQLLWEIKCADAGEEREVFPGESANSQEFHYSIMAWESRTLP